jgi:hypothetical protein
VQLRNKTPKPLVKAKLRGDRRGVDVVEILEEVGPQVGFRARSGVELLRGI